MRALALFVLAACQAGDPSGSPCARAYAHLATLGSFAGSAGPSAVAFGLGCAQLSSDDTACLASTPDVARCSPAAQHAVSADSLALPSSGPVVSDQQVKAVLDGLCACKDAACLIDFAARHRDAVVGVLGAGNADTGAQLGKCLLAVPAR